MKLIVLFLLSFCVISTAIAKDINEELAYRVRFSSAADVELLLKKGADPNAVNVTGLPMVSVAAMRTDEEVIPIIKTLVAHGADINRGGVNNQYPVIIAARENNTRMMTYLIDEAKANFMVRDLNGLNVLEIAEYYGNEEIIEMIGGLVNEQLEKEKWLKSDERRLQLMEKLGKSYCENQYMYYYYISGQDNFAKEFIEAEAEKYRLDIQSQLQVLNRYFGLSYEYAMVLKKEIGDVLKQEFESMISNRERKRRGIGTDKDLKERCGRIADTWYQNYLQKH